LLGACFETYELLISLIFQIFGGGCLKLWIQGSVCIMKLCVLWFAGLK